MPVGWIVKQNKGGVAIVGAMREIYVTLGVFLFFLVLLSYFANLHPLEYSSTQFQTASSPCVSARGRDTAVVLSNFVCLPFPRTCHIRNMSKSLIIYERSNVSSIYMKNLVPCQDTYH